MPGEPYFERHAANRFDDPNKQFGACYCGLQLDTAIAESVLHDALPEKGQFRIRQEEIDTRYLVTFVAGAGHGILRLADLTGQHPPCCLTGRKTSLVRPPIRP